MGLRDRNATKFDFADVRTAPFEGVHESAVPAKCDFTDAKPRSGFRNLPFWRHGLDLTLVNGDHSKDK